MSKPEAAGPTWLGELARIDAPDPGLFRERYSLARRPVVIRGATGGWPALRTWSAAHLRERLGPQRVKVLAQEPDAQNAPRGDRAKQLRHVSFADFVDSVACSPPKHYYYLTYGNIESRRLPRGERPTFGALAPDVPAPELLPRRRLFEINLWMAYDGAVTNLHFDPFDNLLCVVHGRKRLRVFAPAQSRHLHLEPALATSNPLHSPVNALAPDLNAHPRFGDAAYHTAVLERGDALYLPAGYWHHVVSEGFNLAVNFWWKSEHWLFEQLRSPMRRNILSGLARLRRLARPTAG